MKQRIVLLMLLVLGTGKLFCNEQEEHSNKKLLKARTVKNFRHSLATTEKSKVIPEYYRKSKKRRKKFITWNEGQDR